MEEPSYQYGVLHTRRKILCEGPTTYASAAHFIEGWISDGGDPTHVVLVKREISSWEICED